MKNRFLSAIIIALIVGAIFSLLFSIGFYQHFQFKLSDMLYGEKNPLNNIVIIAIDDKSLQEIGRWPWPRSTYLKLLPKINESKVIGLDVAFFESEISDKKIGDALRKINTVIPVEYTKFEKGKGVEILNPVKEYDNITTGFVNIITDGDGIVRTTPLVIDGVETHNSFALEIYNKFRNRNTSLGFNKLIINFIGGPGTFTTYSFVDVLEQDINFTNKIVLIGATSPGLHDEFFTPISVGKATSGVEINANILQTLITKDYLKRQSVLSTIIMIFIFSLIVGASIGLLRLRWATLISAVLFIVYLFFAIIIFDKANLIVNLIYPFAVIIFTYLSTTAYFYFTEQKERKKIHSLFGKYVSKDVVEEILSKSEKGIVDLKGEERNVTLLFADIRGFTRISEKMRPHKVVDMLNKYLGKMTDSIFKYKGTVDKYMGDCIMAMFGAPLKQKDHALNAIKAALDMQKTVAEVSKTRGVPKIKVGIGINSGEAVIGNMGSTKRVEYTAIGDTVNLASRLCSAAQGGQIIISEGTYKPVKDKIKVKALGKIKVKGKAKPVKIYQVLGLSNL